MRLPWHSLRWRLGLSMSLGVLALLLLSLLGAYLVLRADALRTGTQQHLAQQRLIAEGLEEVFARVERRTNEFAQQILSARPNPDQLSAMMQSRVLTDPDTASMGVLLEPVNPVRTDGRFAVIATYSSRGLLLTDFVQTGYDYWTKDWYLQTSASAHGWWSDPYFNDAAGGQDTVTLDYPLRDGAGHLLGMIGVSITVDRLIELAVANGLTGTEGSRYVISDARGRILLMWDPALERAYTLAQAAERTGSPALSWLAKADPQRDAKAVHLSDPEHGSEHLVYAVIPRVGWRVATIVPQAQMLAPLHASIGRVIGLTLLIAFGVLPLLFLLARRVAEPLAAILRATERLAQGQRMSVALPGGPGEIGQLALAVDQVGQRLAGEIERARSATEAERNHQEQWSRVAQSQRALLPADRVFFGPNLQCELSGQVLVPERIGRSSYGFFAPAPGLCSFFLASVSGGELAAALQASRLVTLLSALLRQGGGPADVLKRACEQWANDGDIELRPQVIVGQLNLDTGHLSLASADHPPPLLMTEGRSAQVIDLTSGPAIGMNDRGDWQAWHSTLGGGDCLAIASSGLLGCRDRSDHSYGRQGLPDILQRTANLPIRVRMNTVRDDVQKHCAHGTQSGDLALLIVTVKERD